MAIGVITGSGTYSLPGFEHAEPERVRTPFGSTDISRGEFGGVELLHVSRHGTGHVRLSNHVEHRANIWALHELGAQAVIGCTACGAVDPTLELGSLVVFDDLHFISNRLPDGSLCTFSTEAGDPGGGIGSCTAARFRPGFARRWSLPPQTPAIPRATAAPTVTSMVRVSTPRRR